MGEGLLPARRKGHPEGGNELRDIPGVLIHGRRDISGPALTAWRLHRAWTGSRLEIVEEDGHGGPGSAELARAAIDAFAEAARDRSGS